jgi:hypothetical protein
MEIGAPAELVDVALIDVRRLRVERASDAELAAHLALLAGIAHETRRPTVWSELPAATA